MRVSVGYSRLMINSDVNSATAPEDVDKAEGDDVLDGAAGGAGANGGVGGNAG